MIMNNGNLGTNEVQLTVEVGRAKLGNDEIVVEYGKSKFDLDSLKIEIDSSIVLDTEVFKEGSRSLPTPLVNIYINGNYSAKGQLRRIFGIGGRISVGVSATETFTEVRSDVLNALKFHIVELSGCEIITVKRDSGDSFELVTLYDVFANGERIARCTTSIYWEVDENDMPTIPIAFNAKIVELVT